MAIECGFVDEKCVKKKLTGMVSLDVAKAFNTIWVSGLLYKPTVLNFSSYLVKSTSSHLHLSKQPHLLTVAFGLA
jgi:hypothetical protein